MGPRRSKKKVKEDVDINREITNDSIEFDPKKLFIVVEGHAKSFDEWTLDYAKHYYPGAGTKTYRVPPVDFNTQPLTDDLQLGYSCLGQPKEENRKKDRSQADVGYALESLGHRLELSGQKGLFIVSNAQYDNYLSDLKGLKLKGKQPPLPHEVASRGELDILVLNDLVGIVLIQVKGVGFADSWQPTEQQRLAAIEKKVKEAVGQLDRDERVLHHILQDLHLRCPVHRVVALPYVPKADLHKTAVVPSEPEPDAAVRPLPRYLCWDDMVSTNAVWSWWNGFGAASCEMVLAEEQLQKIVGRYCGLMSTVSVWCKSSLRVEVRDVAEAAEEVGARFASIVLTTEQQAALDCREPYIFLHGPPGSGKSVMMVVRARKWLKDGHDVCVINPDFGRQGMPVGYYIHDSISQWLAETYGGWDSNESSSSGYSESEKSRILSKSYSENTDINTCRSLSSGSLSSDTDSIKGCDVGRVFRIDFDFGMNFQGEKEVIEKLLQEIKCRKRPEIPCHFLWDEFYWKDRLVSIIDNLKREFPTSCIWCAEVSGNKIPGFFKSIRLETVLRCPPSVQALLKRTDPHVEHTKLYTNDSTLYGLPTDGFQPRLIEHRTHKATSPLDCYQCADDLLEFFRLELKLHFGEDTVVSSHCPQTEAAVSSGAASCLSHAAAGFQLSSSSQSPELLQDSPNKGTRVIEDLQQHTCLASADSHIASCGDVLGLSSKKCSPNSLPIPKRKKKRNVCYPRRIKFSDIVVVFSYPRSCLKRTDNLLIVTGSPEDLHHSNIENSVFYRHMKDAGLPAIFLAPKADAREIALPAEDRVLFTVTNAVTGLERKVVVYIPCESTSYSYPLNHEIGILTAPADILQQKISDKPVLATKCPEQLCSEIELANESCQQISEYTSCNVKKVLCAKEISSAAPISNQVLQHKTTLTNCPIKPEDIIANTKVPSPLLQSNIDLNDAHMSMHKSLAPPSVSLSEENWAKIYERMLEQNQKGMFYAASRCLSVFVLIIP